MDLVVPCLPVARSALDSDFGQRSQYCGQLNATTLSLKYKQCLKKATIYFLKYSRKSLTLKVIKVSTF